MRTLWKYSPWLDAVVHIETKKGAVLRKIDADPRPSNSSRPIAFWFELDDEAPDDTQSFIIVGTGHEVPPGAGDYIASAITGSFVWHVYKMLPPENVSYTSRF